MNEAINVLKGHRWVVEDDYISFTEGRLVNTGRFFRVIGWDGTIYRGATTPRVAVRAWEKGMTRHA